jgi:hypothetical protein
MGGLGSGRWKDRGRKTVESYWTLDVNQLSEKVTITKPQSPLDLATEMLSCRGP